jgi:transcription elongation factor Elf1
MENNIRCKECGHEFFVSKYCIGSKGLYESRSKVPLLCPECGGDVELIMAETVSIPNINRFNSMSDQQKKEVLRKRSKAHFDRDEYEFRRKHTGREKDLK